MQLQSAKSAMSQCYKATVTRRKIAENGRKPLQSAGSRPLPGCSVMGLLSDDKARLPGF